VLEARSGPLRGQSFPIETAEFTIGRDPSNLLAIPDPGVSRFHCVIESGASGWRLRDLGARNVTLINDATAPEKILHDADVIRIGASTFLFHASATPTAEGIVVDAAPFEGDTVVLRRDELHLALDGSASRQLNALLEFSKRINQERTIEGLLQCTLDSAQTLVPAERCAVVLTESETLHINRTLSSHPDLRLSRGILQRVVQEGLAVLSRDAGTDHAWASSDSILQSRVRSLLAVPLDAAGQRLGLLYLDTQRSAAAFDASHLRLLAALGAIAALALANLQHLAWLEGENRRLNEELDLRYNMVGESPAMRDVYQFISRVGPRETNVLIYGESGTGKELVARAIHKSSPRANGPFVAINCAAIAEHLLESELFGYEKGAFTGAVSQKRGRLEVAEGGTVFLDEIGELAPQLQAKLLRVIQEREFERVGGTRLLKLNIRLVAATNRDLKEMARRKEFREDLYYRLDVVSHRLPSLRDRREDIPALADYFAIRAGEKVNRRVTGLSPKAKAALLRYDWPGNVRELENAIERAVVLGDGDLILPEDLPDAVLDRPPLEEDELPEGSLQKLVTEYKRKLVLAAIEKANGNQAEAARALDLHENSFYRLLRNLGIPAKKQRQG
jgi:Nif-specific regulatory protein